MTHNLLRVVDAVLRDGEPYRDPKVDYTQLLVDRNAPRWLRDLKQYGWLPQHSSTDQYRAAVRGALTGPIAI